MPNSMTISIQDRRGLRQFTLHELMQKIILSFIAFVVFLFVLAAGIIYYLNYSIDKIEEKKKEIQSEYGNLNKKNNDLADLIKNKEETIQSQEQKILNQGNYVISIEEELNSIESLIGLGTNNDGAGLSKRLSNAKLTSRHVAIMFRNIPNGWPVKNYGITSDYGMRDHPVKNKRIFHRGLDLRASMKTPIYATADALVEYAGYHKRSGYGRLIILSHNFGFKSFYGHLSKLNVRAGRFVKKGDLIGYTGNSGISNGPHLHYEVRYLSSSVNPRNFVKWSILDYKKIFKKEKKIKWDFLVDQIQQTTCRPTQAQ